MTTLSKKQEYNLPNLYTGIYRVLHTAKIKGKVSWRIIIIHAGPCTTYYDHKCSLWLCNGLKCTKTVKYFTFITDILYLNFDS